ncbi:MAG TPA: type IV secretion system protein [Steroidobacteraceae bacterium]|jgi:type IV secretion system protein VirB8|nr:type IV secretion system protein [Steroidobacteraceae bacterium]
MSNAAGQSDLSGYFAEARCWDRDRVEHTRRMARAGWAAAAAAGICALATSCAVLVMMPLKQTEPYLIRVDNTTGVIDVVPVYAGQATFDEAITRYFVSHYVSVCERFNFATAQSDYEECGAFHDARRNQAWYQQWNRNNPQSPLNVHRDGGTVAVQVSSVTFLKAMNGSTQTAQVRYIKVERTSPDVPDRLTPHIATIQYSFTPPSADPRNRRWNPLGFKVTEFTTEPEILGEKVGSVR